MSATVSVISALILSCILAIWDSTTSVNLALVTTTRSVSRVGISLRGSLDDCAMADSDFITSCSSFNSLVPATWLFAEPSGRWLRVTSYFGMQRHCLCSLQRICSLARRRPGNRLTHHAFGVTQGSGQVRPRTTCWTQISVVHVNKPITVGHCRLFVGATCAFCSWSGDHCDTVTN